MALAIARDVVGRLVGQMQRIDAFLLRQLSINVQQMQHQFQQPPPGTPEGQTPRGREGFHRITAGESEMIAIQIAPWTFLTSSYAWSLLIMAAVLSRIQHIVTPPRANPRQARPPPERNKAWNVISTIWYYIIPVNMSSTLTRAVLRLPTLYLLYRSFILQLTVWLQATGTMPQWPILKPLNDWAAHLDMGKICWMSFSAVCAALFMNALTRGLDGSPHSHSIFNLPQYAFLLHIYSSPYSDMFIPADPLRPAKLPRRPSPHVLFTLLLPLLQITIHHTQCLRKRWSNHLLIPTAASGILALVHFNYAIYTRHILEYPYALLVPSIFEEFFLLQILLTTGLNALTQILLQGWITRPLLGVGAAALPDLDEDFGVALIRIGTCSLAATSTLGLGNEVAEVHSADHTFVKLERNSATVHGPMVLGTRIGKTRPGLSNEITRTKVKKNDTVPWLDFPWMNEMRRFFRTFWRVLRKAFHARRSQEDSPEADIQTDAVGAPIDDGGGEELTVEQKIELKHAHVYASFLRGDPITDDEDEPYEEGSRSHSDGDEDGDDESLQDGEVDDPTFESTELFLVHAAESSGRASTPTPLAPILLAHLTSLEGSPLTRRRYSDLVPCHSSATAPAPNSPQSRRNQFNIEDDVGSEQGRHLCVICWSADRSIICWPCRCLAMCDDCRAHIASRSTATRHTCPCCKQGVDGYSRIYIP